MVQSVSAAFDKLTPREREILRLIAAHLQSKEIARALGLSPKTVEMHVLSARRRLSGLSRRDAALAFVAWEGGDPGNDYRRQSDDLAPLAVASLPDREIASGQGEIEVSHGLRTTVESDVSSTSANRVAPRQRTALEGLVVAILGDDRPVTTQQDWRHRMSPPQWLGLILASAALTTALMAITAISIHEFMKAVERIWRF
ncbi:LuxR C-terminal-related transcriptional regulator [Caulobacter sp. RL271]|uniref:Helix-turn-helix transcriptional regulator n=1 Tax=Caulobacter segnis TaxID=88688 RepID=A0ABY4ZTL9_9CAUL|nr:helix-turn-helix transcriptional regulator [Caulobacter segnis]USQ95921.1 helix-turn-helix transcriptional regulator [Caulobacter segnis]